MKPRILIATAEAGYAVVRDIFADDADPVFVFRLQDAINEIDQGGFDCILCTIHFDDSRMFDLVRYARARAPEVPCVCTRLLDTMLKGSLLQGMLIAVDSLGAKFVDRYELQRAYGEKAGDEQFKRLVLAISTPDP